MMPFPYISSYEAATLHRQSTREDLVFRWPEPWRASCSPPQSPLVAPRRRPLMSPPPPSPLPAWFFRSGDLAE
jgi:hypothetical protein